MDGSQIAGNIAGVVLLIAFPVALVFVAFYGLIVAFKIHAVPLKPKRRR